MVRDENPFHWYKVVNCVLNNFYMHKGQRAVHLLAKPSCVESTHVERTDQTLEQ